MSDVEARLQRLERILEINCELTSTTSREDLLRRITEAAVELTQSQSAAILLLDEGSGELRFVAATRFADQLAQIPVPIEGTVAGRAFSSGESVVVHDPDTDSLYYRAVEQQIGYKAYSLLAVPLQFKEQRVGVLEVENKVNAEEFSQEDVETLTLLAAPAAVAIENARLVEALQEARDQSQQEVTERTRAEEELGVLRDHLQELVRERTAELEALNEELEQEIAERRQAEEALSRNTERLRTLHEIGQSVLAARLPETIAVAAIHRMRQLIPCQRAMVLAVEDNGPIQMLATESGGELGLVADIGVYEGMLEERPLSSGWVSGAADLAALAHRSPWQESLYESGVRSYVVAPLFIQEELVGTLNVESSEPGAFAPDHITIATEVAASLAVAIRQARLYEQAQQEIAERMRAEAALQQYTAELERRNSELDAFAHTVAHDLKNPVSAIMGYSDVLEQNYESLAEDILERFLHGIGRNAHKMATIIDELLLLSSVRGVDKIEVEPLDMERIVGEARKGTQRLLEEHQGEIIVPDAWPEAVGYASWIEAVWTNYISNAIKYGGQPPRVELGANSEENGTIRFWVQDNGPGLSPEEQARLFTPFERLHQARAQGHGLGLSIVQRILKKLGGQAGVESEGVAGEGSTFYFTLPAAGR